MISKYIKEPEVLDVYSLLQKDTYTIPLYQRNYAWTEVEITQLLQDIWDKFDNNNDKESNYYIGTLIVDQQPNDIFEIIDGQQRHTTLTLINAVIIGLYEAADDNIIGPPKSNLKFEAREESEKLINELLGDYGVSKNSFDNLSLENIIQAVRDIEKKLKSLKEEYESDFFKFITYFYKSVKIVRVNVPADTDINHYFEIMNSRGEQLEKHEILKAKFIDSLKDEKQRKKFGLIWDACSQMDKHIQMCFTMEQRKEIFSNNSLPNRYMNDLNAETQFEDNKGDVTNFLSNIIQSYKLKEGFNQNEKEGNYGRYKSIIDFPNFLLQILRLENNGVSLDDKKLLDEFGYTTNIDGRELPDAITFANKLLMYRALFDKYIIKREEGDNTVLGWKISTPNENNETDYYVNTFDERNHKKIMMIQSMLHVSFANNSYKYWLNDTLKALSKTQDIEADAFLLELEVIATRRFSFSKKDCNKGTNTNSYIFNYLDYLLWKEYNDKVLTNNLVGTTGLLGRINKNRKKFNDFRFTQNNSVEHLHPQVDIEGLTVIEDSDDSDFHSKDKIMDNFGNLCLIGRGSNSKYNDYNFEAKKLQFSKRSSVESLKQVIMFDYKDWGSLQIKEHLGEMLSILNIQ